MSKIDYMHNFTSGSRARSSGVNTAPVAPIAIVGMGLRVPGAEDVRAFWRNLVAGVESISRLRDDELEDAFSNEVRGSPNYVKARPLLEGVENFDAEFFGMYPREAELTDPQHRVFLECAWEALEDAGYDPARYPGAVGVFAGAATMNTYFLNNVCTDRAAMEQFTSQYQLGHYPMMVGAGHDFLATRVSYKLNLRGPAVTVQSACSTSLLAVAQACQSLQLGQADVALAGGVSISFPQRRGYLHQEGGMASADGHCRSFDAAASGTVFGSGAGVVLLKRLENALADGDHVYAVIHGCGINNDGAGKTSFTAPSSDGQAGAIELALTQAGFDARSIGYVECHGTATPLGDPIEIAGLTKAFRASTAERQFCAVGSVKSNVGHLDAAAGVVGLIKAALVLKHRTLPASLHYRKPNPQIDFENSPFFVNARLADWPEGVMPRRVGVSAFGVGGTNVHVVLQEAPPAAENRAAVSQEDESHQLLVFSARSEAALDAACARFGEHLRQHPELLLPDVAYSLQTGRRSFSHRRAIVCGGRDEALRKLALAPSRAATAAAHSEDVSVAFMFPGQGAQYPGMGEDLYRRIPVFRRQIDRCARILGDSLGADLRDLMYPAERGIEAQRRLLSTGAAQPAIFSVEYALAQLWMSWGVRPQAMIGHSIGEFVAAVLAGVLSLEDALHVVAARGRLMQSLPAGAMLAVRAPEQDVKSMLNPELAIAAINGVALCVVSGTCEAVAALERSLTARGLSSRRLHTSHAFHSPMMEPILEPLREQLERVHLSVPTVPYVSCVTGDWITPEQATSPDYWARHAREPVRFSDGIATLTRARAPFLVEAGPGDTLSRLATQATRGRDLRVIASLPDIERAVPDIDCMLAGLGELWVRGATPDWIALHGVARTRVSLPTYPFQRSRHWIEAPPRGGMLPAARAPAPSRPAPIAAPPLLTLPAPAAHTHLAPLRAAILAIVETLSGQKLPPAQCSASFLELGFDSLFLGQVAQRIEVQLKVRVSFRQLLKEHPTIDALAAFLHERAQLPPPAAAAAVEEPAGAPFQHLFSEQLEAMSGLINRQLEALQDIAHPAAEAAPPEGAPPERFAAPDSAPAGDAALIRSALTEGQTEIWLSAQMGDEASCAFNESLSLRFEGRLDEPVLRDALDAVVARRDALRGRFTQSGEEMLIAPPQPLAWAYADFAGESRPAAEAAYQALLAEDARTPFDLVNGPLLRVHLVRLAAEAHALVISVHHLVCDGWSLNVIVDELRERYAAACRGDAPALGAAPSFAAYAHDACNADAAELAELDQWWLKQFEPGARPLELPADHPPPARRPHRAAICSQRIEPAQAAALRKAGARAGCTLFATLLGAFQALLGRLADCDDVTVGIPTAAQSQLTDPDLVGYCVHFLPLRARWDRETRLEAHLAAVSKSLFEAYEHQRYTLGTLARKLDLPRDASRLPLTEARFNLLHLPERQSWPGLEVRLGLNPKSFVNFDLVLNVSESPGDAAAGLRIECEYSAERFEPATIERWLECYRALLVAIVDDASQPLASAPMLPPPMREALIAADRASASAYPRERGIHELFEAQVAATPAAVAAQFGNTVVTYEGLDRRANQLANHLVRSLGPASDSDARPVGVCVERSLDMLVALLAVLKSGRGYVPLDPLHPQARLQHILGEAAVAALIVDQGAAASIAPPGTPVIDLGVQAASIAAASHAAPAGGACSGRLAYLIYTSGSTGAPKGVEVTHQSVVNLLTSMAREPGFAARDVMLALTTVSFDIAALELFLPLCVGARVIIAAREDAADGEALCALVKRSGATVMQATPASWRMLLEAGFAAPADFKMLCGGEALPRELANRLLANGGELWNLYGPTETTIWSSCARIEAGTAPITVGRPIANTRFYVLDRNDQLLPPGVPGQLHIGGDGVARRYRGKAALTAEKFIADPFIAGAGARIYRSGDLARRLGDGGIEVLGRIDHQIKLRGFRIEPGEIEAVLTNRAGLAAAAVLLREDTPGAPRLVAYYVERPGAPRKPAELRALAAQDLPDYMLPSAWVNLARLPLSPNGKLDRKALPAPEAAPVADAEYVAPTHPLEATLARIWAEVLQVERVGIDQDLFMLGADSIQLFRIVARANREGLRFSAKELLRERSIAALARYLESGEGKAGARRGPPPLRKSRLPK